MFAWRGTRAAMTRVLPTRPARLLFARLLFAGTLLVILVTGPQAAGATSDQARPAEAGSGEEVVISTKPIAPFVFVGEDGEVSGYSVDLWNEIADRIDVTSRYVARDDVADLIDDVASGKAAVGIAAISMTPEREDVVGFSYPYYDSGLKILVRKEGSGTWDTVRAKLTSPQVLYPVAGFGLLIVAIAHLVWLFERRTESDDFPKPYLRGVWEGLFWSVVTVTTGGDAEKRLRRVGGRVVGMAWMLFGLFVVAYLTASVTSALTIAELKSGITGFGDLPAGSVVTVEDTVAEQYLTDRQIEHRTVPTIERAQDALLDGRVDAFVYDAPVLDYFAGTAGSGKVEVVGAMAKPDTYGIALHDDTYSELINR
ncbi:MAG: transporter substrate-binding domain-containing protein, partial [Nocardioides sp.]